MNNKSEEEKIIFRKNISKGLNNRSDNKKKETSKKISNSLLNMPNDKKEEANKKRREANKKRYEDKNERKKTGDASRGSKTMTNGICKPRKIKANKIEEYLKNNYYFCNRKGEKII